MAMTKKEQAQLANLEHELRMARAFRWPEENPKPDIAPPKWGEEATSGWVFNQFRAADGSVAVEQAWSESGSHGQGSPRRESGRCGSQGGIALFSTRILALKAVRYAVAKQAAFVLAKLDEQIEIEAAQASSPGESQ